MKYDTECDIWSLGRFCQKAYPLLGLPNDGDLDDTIYKQRLRACKAVGVDVVDKIEKINISRSSPIELSRDCLDLLQKMLTVDPEKRITVDVCLEHQWITESIDDSPLAFTRRLLIQ
eukprot:GHVH01014873.1.p1 GENE.GHVH01014873.1~~GHVH01014873.1.p1  ORF type:complete len:117 (-),score=14.72 GHVH01014873.1:819-1169(-)